MHTLAWPRLLIGTAAILTLSSVAPAGTTLVESAPPIAIETAPTESTPSLPALRLPSGKPELKSSAVLVFDAEDSAVLYARQAKRPQPVASITKLMTALVALESDQSLDDLVKITKEDRDTVYGSHSRLTVGAQLSRGDLLHLALMSSDNRAAHAIGRTYPGGLGKFVRAMNRKAQVLGMKSAKFVDPTGLSSGNVASAEDLAKLVIAAANDPVIQTFSTNAHYTVKVGKQQLEFRNTNALVSKADWSIAVQKTGYTQAAGQCLVMQAMIQERPIVIVLLNSFGKYTRVADARRIRRWMEANTQPALASAAKGP